MLIYQRGKWKQSLSKDKLAKMYRREYNMQIRIIRLSVRHRHDGKIITNYEALRKELCKKPWRLALISETKIMLKDKKKALDSFENGLIDTNIKLLVRSVTLMDYN